MAHHDPSAEIAGRRNLERAATGAVLALAFVLSALLFESAPKAALYPLSLAIFVARGIPFAKRWLDGSFAVLAGAALGYLASSLAASVLARLELLGAGTMVAASIGLYFISRLVSSFVPERPRGDGDASRGFFAAALLLPLLVVTLPF